MSAGAGRALTAPPQQTQSKEALLKSYTKRLKDDVKSMVDNYLAILNLSKFEDNPKNLAQISRSGPVFTKNVLLTWNIDEMKT